MADPVRVLIVDDHAGTRQGLRMRLAREPDLAIVGDAGDVRNAMWLARQLKPDVVVVDLNLDHADGLELIQRMRQTAPECRYLILSMDDSPSNRHRAAAGGIDTFVGKQQPVEVLLAAIRSVAAPRVT